MYLAAWNLLQSNQFNNAPSSISDFIIALNLFTQDIKVSTYKASDVLLTNDKDLASLLTLSSIDKARTIRILDYLHKLDNDLTTLTTLPRDILIEIISKLDCQSILLLCQISNEFSKFCELNLQLLLKESLKITTKLNIDNYKIRKEE